MGVLLLFEGAARKAGGPVNKRTPANDVPRHSPVPPPPSQSTKPTAAESNPAMCKKTAAVLPSRHRPQVNDDDDDDGLPPPPSATNMPVIRVESTPHPPPPPPSSNKPGSQPARSHQRRPSDSGLLPTSPSALTDRRPSFDNIVTPAGMNGISPSRTGMPPPPPPPPNRPSNGNQKVLPPPPPPRKTATLTTSGPATTGRPSKTSSRRPVNGSPVPPLPAQPPPPPPARPPPSIHHPSAAPVNSIDSNSVSCFSGLSPVYSQCFDTVRWVISPVIPIPDMFGGTLNLIQPSTVFPQGKCRNSGMRVCKFTIK